MERENPAVGNRCASGISGEIRNGIIRSGITSGAAGKRGKIFDFNVPVFSVAGIQQLNPITLAREAFLVFS